MEGFKRAQYMISLFCILLLSLTSCEDTISIAFSSNELLSSFENNPDYGIFLKKSELYVTGKVAWISYPKDGFKLNECAIYLETDNSNAEKRTGDFISCHMLERVERMYTGKTLIIHGKYDSYKVINNEKYIILKKCKIVITQ